MKKLRSSLVAVCLLAAIACGRSEKSAEDISETLNDKGTTDVLKDAANDKYTPPADGKLTDAQVQMYLKVRERESAIAKVARDEAQVHAKKAEAAGEKSVGGVMEAFKTLGSVADLATADIRAAQELGVNTAEYTWVKTTILSVSSADFSQQIAGATSGMMDAGYAETKKQYDAATDPATKKMLGDALAQYDKAKTDMDAQANAQSKDPAFAHNKQLLSKYEGTLNALATEMAKYSGVAAPDLNKQMSDLEKAAAQAQSQTK